MVAVASIVSALIVFQGSGIDSDALSEMNDLGTIMLAGFILAVFGAIALTVIRIRIREKKPDQPQFISINSREED